MAEGLLRRAAEARGQSVVVLSAGTAYDGHPASDGSVAAMARRGIDLTRHRSRVMWGELVASADLAIGMARVHVREATVLAPDRFGRIFTLKELVRRGRAVGPRGDQPLDEWLEKVGADRLPVDLLRDDPVDDVEDPIGRRQHVYDQVADEIERLVHELADLLWGPIPTDHARGGSA